MVSEPLLPGLKLRRTPRELLAADCRALIGELARIGPGGWASAKELIARLPPGWTERRVRMAASAEPRILAFPGSPGYKLFAAAAPGEIIRAIDTLHAQAKNMAARAQAYTMLWHRHRAHRAQSAGGVPPPAREEKEAAHA
jgi:hypothetical protein